MRSLPFLFVGISACLAASFGAVVFAEGVSTFPAGASIVFPARVDLKSDKVDAQGAHHGPWKSAVVLASLPRAVKRGELLTVVPLKADLAPVDLKVTSVEAQEATDLTEATWLTEAETTLPAFLDAKPDAGRAEEHPLEALVIYPKQSRARLLPPAAAAADLPPGPGHSPQTLWAAVDLDEDGKADAEVFRFCCNRPKRAWLKSPGPSTCKSNCENIYVRAKGGSWTLAHEQTDL
jgi:hypothetical protein